MRGRLAVVSLLFAALVAGCADSPDVPPAKAEFHSVTDLPGGSYNCAGCHYGIDPVWITQWEEAGDGAWDLVVRSAWPAVDLLSVNVAEGNASAFSFDSKFLDEPMDGTWVYPFEVAEGAASLFVRFYTHSQDLEVGPVGAADPTGGPMADGHPDTELVLVDPAGARTVVEGPENELKQTTILDPMPGAWSFEGRTLEGGAVRGRGYVEVGMGQAAADLAFGESARFRFAGDVPPDVTLGVRPYHDHAPFEYGGQDWDYADSFPYRMRFLTLPGPAPAPYVWTEDVVDGFWSGASEVPIQQDRTFDMIAAYQEEAGTQNEDPVTIKASSPYYYTPADPVPPGTAKVRFEMTWNPPVEEPDLQMRFGPAETPYYRDATPVERAAGRAVFEADWDPLWWDVHFEDGAPVLDAYGSVDIAPYIAAQDGEVRAYVLQVTLDAYAVRGPVA